MVKARTSLDKVVVTADGEGVVSHAGSALLVGLADRVGLTRALSEAMEPTRQRASAHDPGVVLRDLAVMLADGGTSLSALGVLRDQEAMFGLVASDSTAYRVIDSIDQTGLGRLRAAVAIARERAWELGAAPKEVVLDWDATLVTAFSHKQGAAATYKKGFGHHPLLCYLDCSREALAGILREGNAGSNTAADHITVGDQALTQLPACALDGEIVARVDGAGATHAFTRWCRDAGIRFSVGAKLTEDVLQAALMVDDQAWKQGLRKDGSENPAAWVCELTGQVSIGQWPRGSRLICRAVRLDEAIQLTFGEDDGFRYEVFLTDIPGDIRDRDLFHRGHARIEDRVRDAKACGLENLPFQSFANNQVWLLLVGLAQDLLAWSQAILLSGDLKRAEPQTLRYRLWHTAARISRHARTTRLRLDRHWPWAQQLVAAFTVLQALPHT
ncbi:MAG: IS1380 family transposase [Actinomycetota bacterium]|nr:IS1380 family transposase [Actinomycetota bacterium]